MEVAEGSLLMHYQRNHGVDQGDWDPPPQGGPNLPGIFPKTSVVAPVTGGGVPGRGLKPDQPPGSLFAPPHAGHNSDPGGREPTAPQVPPVLHVCVSQGTKRPALDDSLPTIGNGEEAASPVGGGGTGRGRGSDHRPRDTPHPGHLLQVYREISLGGG